MVVDVAEVPLVFFGETGELGESAHEPGERVALRADGFTHADEQTFHLKGLL